MFIKTEEDLGTIVAKSSNIVNFPADSQVTNVEIVPPSCDCTRPEWNSKTHEVVVTYAPSNLSSNIMKLGTKQYEAVRQITVHFDYAGIRRTQFLTIKAIVLGKQ